MRIGMRIGIGNEIGNEYQYEACFHRIYMYVSIPRVGNGVNGHLSMHK